MTATSCSKQSNQHFVMRGICIQFVLLATACSIGASGCIRKKTPGSRRATIGHGQPSTYAKTEAGDVSAPRMSSDCERLGGPAWWAFQAGALQLGQRVPDACPEPEPGFRELWKPGSLASRYFFRCLETGESAAWCYKWANPICHGKQLRRKKFTDAYRAGVLARPVPKNSGGIDETQIETFDMIADDQGFGWTSTIYRPFRGANQKPIICGRNGVGDITWTSPGVGRFTVTKGESGHRVYPSDVNPNPKPSDPLPLWFGRFGSEVWNCNGSELQLPAPWYPPEPVRRQCFREAPGERQSNHSINLTDKVEHSLEQDCANVRSALEDNPKDWTIECDDTLVLKHADIAVRLVPSG